MNPLRELATYDQAIWLDHFDHDLLDGELMRLIEVDGLKGLTSNPAILEKAFDNENSAVKSRKESSEIRSPKELFEALALEELGAAADVFRPLYENTNKLHGWVSLEVDPRLAHDTEGTVREGQRLFQELARPNAFVKVPATKEGVLAIERLIALGVNVNVTLLFGLKRYQDVIEAYLKGIEKRVNDGLAVDDVRSVASFFLSRIDSLIDDELKEIAKRDGDDARLATWLRGEVAIASAKLAHQIYRTVSSSDRWRALESNGAHPQWLLWASTSTKDPTFDELKYVEALIGADTINTLPPKTLAMYREKGRPAPRLTQDIEHSRLVLERLARVGIDLDEVAARLETQGVEKFVKPFEKLLQRLERRLQAA